MAMPRIEKSVFLKADAGRIWALLTEPEELARWFHPTHATMVAGKTYGLYRKASDRTPLCHGRVLETEAPRRLVYTFTHEWLGQHETRVEWSLTELGEGTWLRLVHGGFEDVPVDALDALFEHDSGWDEHLVKLREVIQAGATQPA